MLRQTKSYFAVNPTEMLKKATIHFVYLMNDVFGTSVLFNMLQ